MRKISDTIARLAALQATTTTRSTVAGGADRLKPVGSFGSNPGALTAKCHLPDNLQENAPLVVVLHGCTQTAAAYDHHSGWSDLADEAGFAVLYAEQQRANNQNLCFNWFQPGDARRDAGEALSIRQMIETMITKHGLDRKRVFVTGLSAGGAMAAAMLASYPELFAGGAIIAGLPFGSANSVPEAFDRMRGHGGPSAAGLQRALQDASGHTGPWPRISIWQGSADHTVAPVNATLLAEQWRAAHDVNNTQPQLESTGRLARQVWHDRGGKAVLEVNVIAGMGHGTPLSSDLGTPGPYMLDVGISSTREIAAWWEIAAAAGHITPKPERQVSGSSSAKARPNRQTDPAPTAEPPADHPAPGSPAGVKKIIDDALRVAGLMR